MKNNPPMTSRPGRRLMILTTTLLASLALGTAMAGVDKCCRGVMTEDDEDEGPARPQDSSNAVVIRAIEPAEPAEPADPAEPAHPNHANKPLTWLGVSVEEVTEAMGSQLGLKPGQGLLISYVSKRSPAETVGLQKNDVLVELDGQLLVDPTQLRKLVQMHPEGDHVRIGFYRAGKKETVEATLVKRTWNESSHEMGAWQNDLQQLKLQLHGLTDQDRLRDQMDVLAQSLKGLGFDKEKMDAEIKRTMEETRKAIQDAMRHSVDGHDHHKVLGMVGKELDELAGRGVDLGNDATVIIKNDDKSSKTIVETDDSGSYVITADPGKHLIAHGKDGKLLFDGAIDSREEQQKVPREVWRKIKPLLEQMDKGRVEVETTAPPQNAPENQKP